MLKNFLRKIVKFLRVFGIDIVKLINSIRGLPIYYKDYKKLSKCSNNDFSISFYPVLDDRYKQGGTASGHYFHQDLLVARKIYNAKPERHIDIGSRVDGFIAHLAVFREVEIIDIREINSNIKNIKFIKADVMNMKKELFESCDSLSSLHVLEHFGLGRYGDPIDFNGHIKGFENMYKLLKSSGVFYFSVPIGQQRIEFNAHRVFSLEYLISMFNNKFKIIDFSYVDDKGNLHEHIDLNNEFIEKSKKFDYSCGIFELRKVTNDEKNTIYSF